MSFDRLPGRISNIPQLYHPMQVPQRPVVPWASMILPVVDQIARAIEYQSPYNRQKRQADLSHARLAQEQSAAQLRILPQQTEVQQLQLGAQRDFLKRAQLGGSYGGLPMIPGANGVTRIASPSEAKTLQAYQANDAEARSMTDYQKLAEDARKKAAADVLQTEDEPDGE